MSHGLKLTSAGLNHWLRWQRDAPDVNTVCPCVIDTSRWDNKRDNIPGGQEECERLEMNMPMGRPGTGVEVADTIVFLCPGEGH